MDETIKKILIDGAAELGVELGAGEVGAFTVFLDELVAWNKKINLTSVDNARDIVIKHFLDSLAPCAFLRGTEKVLDIGAGGGFPGLPIKIAMPGVEVTLVDSVGKKVHFMRHVIRKLGLEGATAVAARAEDKSFVAPRTEAFDCVISRAFSALADFVAVSLPFLPKGGRILAMKGPKAAEELAAFDAAAFGVSAPEVHEVRIPFSDRTTTIVILKKL